MPKKFSIVLSILLCLLIFPVIFSSDAKAQTLKCTDWKKTNTSIPYCANFNGDAECQNLQGSNWYCEDNTIGNPPQYYFRCCPQTPQPPPPAECTTDTGCVDTNPCTVDYCLGNGSPGSLCVHNTASEGTVCQYNSTTFQPQLCCSATGACNVGCAPAPPPPGATCSSTNCGACPDCGNCTKQASCGWNGSSCQAGTASCPAGATTWNWDSCTTNVCQPPPPAPAPAPAPPPPPPPPNLTTFTGSCQQAAYTASLNWSGTPLPSNDGGCPNGYWVDISTGSNFSSYSNKCVTGTSLTTNGSEGWMSNGNFSFSPGTTYYARVYNGSHSNTLSLAVPANACTTVCTPNQWNVSLCARCKTDGSGWNASCTDFGTLSPALGNTWCACDLQCPGADNPICISIPTVSCSASPNPAPSGTTVTWTANPSGGSGSFGTNAYLWSADASGTQKQISTTYSNTGTTQITKTATVRVTDSAGKTSQPASCQVQVNPSTAIGGTCSSLFASPSQSNQPVTSTLTATVTNLSAMPGSKLSQWDLDGNGSFETTDTKLSNSVFTSTTKTYSFRVVDGAKSPSDSGYILTNTCSTPVTIIPPAGSQPPAAAQPLGCYLSINNVPYPGSPTVSYNSTITIIASAPSFFTLTLPNDTRDTYNGSASKLFDLSNLGPGTYTVNLNNTPWGGSCNISQTVTAQQSSSDCKVQDSATVITYAFNDPNFDPAAWPSYNFSGQNSTNFPQTTYYPGGLGSSCSSAPECNDGKPCTIDACVGPTDGDGNITNGFCQNRPAPDRTQCRTRNPNCWNWWYHIRNFQECTGPLPVCQSGICMSVNDANSSVKRCSTANDPICNDNNNCTEDKCNLWDDGDGNVNGWCSNTITTGSSCQSGGKNGYCTLGGACSTYACKTDTDCNDNNACTKNDQCVGYQMAGCADDGDGGCVRQEETLGMCQSTNTPSAVCQGSAADPQKLCSSENPSQCNIDYIKCSSPSLNNQYCCGTTNIQQISGGTCYLTPFPNWVGTWSPNLPPKAGVVIHAKGDQCGLDYTNITGSNGRADFSNLPATVGRSSTNKNRVNWTIQADIPNGDKFSRGTSYRVGRNGTYPDSVKLILSNANQAYSESMSIPISCNADGCGVMSTGFATFGFNKPSTPWIQTTGGDVHSNTRINTPGGP